MDTFYSCTVTQAQIDEMYRESEQSCREETTRRAEQLEHVARCVAREGLVVLRSVPYDGDCLYHSILAILPALASSTTALRDRLVEHLKHVRFCFLECFIFSLLIGLLYFNKWCLFAPIMLK